MAKQVLAKELRLLSAEELSRRAADLKETLFNLRLQLRTGELHESSKIARTRRELARVLTVQREQALKIARPGKPAEKTA